MLTWYDFRSRYGTITIKGESEAQALSEAADRWNCTEDEIQCTGSTPYYGGQRLF